MSGTKQNDEGQQEAQTEGQGTQTEGQTQQGTPTPTEGEQNENNLTQAGTTEGQEGNQDGTKPTPWFQKRIDELTREKWDLRRNHQTSQDEINRLNIQIEALRGASNDQNGAGTRQDEAGRTLTESEVEQRAQQLLEARRFNEDCEKVFNAGKAQYNDFEATLANYRDVGGLKPAYVQALLEIDSPEKVLYELGKDRDEAYRIMNLSPIKMAVELTKVATRLNAPAKPAPVSSAPPPVKPPRGGTRPVETDPEKMSTDEWMKWRQEQAKSRNRR